MHYRTLAIALAVFGLFAASPALAKSPHRYTLHGKHCKRGYRKARRPHKTFCIKQPKKKGAALAEKVKLHAHLDPSYTRDPLNPFKVTYAYSASATQEPVAAASISSDSPAPLPSGVLALYSDGQLECAVNVGAGVESSECPVNYQALGAHKVTTIYSSGEQSATATETEVIEPLPTSTQLSVAYEPLGTAITLPGTNWRWVGDLNIRSSAQPGGAQAVVDCGGSAPSGPTDSGCFQLNGSASTQHVYDWPGGCSEAGQGQGPVYINSSAPVSDSVPVDLQISPRAFEAGLYHLRAAVSNQGLMTNAGYAPSEATASLQFTPEIEGECP